jgi:signal transduction histidine kinase
MHLRPGSGIAARLADAEARLSALAAELDHSAARARQFQTVTSGLIGALTPAQVAAVFIRDGLPAVRADAGALVLVSWEERRIRLVGGAGFPPGVQEKWRDVSLDLDYPLQAAIRRGQSIWLPDHASLERDFPEAFRYGPSFSAWAALPLIVGERALGAVALCFDSPGERPEEERTFMTLLSQQCAQALERARLYDAERAARVNAQFAERRISFLADASARLGASLDYRVTLASLARLIVPEFADWVVLRASGSNDRPDVVSAVHRDPVLAARLRAWEEQNPPLPGEAAGAAAALHEGHTELLEEVPPERLVSEARNEKHLALLRSLDTRSRLSVPVRIRDRVLGVVVLGASAVGRRYSAMDRALAEDLAARIAQAIDNAQLYERALAASESKSNFLAMMSHELRTPLNAILGYADLILMGVPRAVGEETRHQVDRMRDAAVRLLALVEEVLSFTRLEANREVVRMEPTRICDVVEDSLAALQPAAAAKGLELVVDMPDPELVVRTDGWKLRHILSNLLTNAMKFTSRGKVELRVVSSEDRLCFEVTDTGIGIAAEHLERIFEPFWQVEQSAARRYEGSGLGLGVARELARLLGGDILVMSKVGTGTTFKLEIPIGTARIGDDTAD